MGEQLLQQAENDAGWHESPSDRNEHLTLKNADGDIQAHVYRDGSWKNVAEAYTCLGWAMPGPGKNL